MVDDFVIVGVLAVLCLLYWAFHDRITWVFPKRKYYEESKEVPK